MPVGASFWHSDWKGWSYGLEREALRCIHPHLQISLQQTYLVHCFYSLFWWKVLETDGWVMKGQPFSWIHLPLWKAKWKVYLLERPLGHFTALPFVSIVGTEQALKASCNDFPFSKRSGSELLPNPGCKASYGCSRLFTLFKADMVQRRAAMGHLF